MGGEPRSHHKYPSARLLSDYYRQAYSIRSLSHHLQADAYFQTPTYTFERTLVDEAGADEVWDNLSDEWNTLMMDGCLASSWQHSYIRQHLVNK